MRLAGIFVGGGSTRMGGHPKGLLPHPVSGEPLVVRLAHEARAAGLAPVLVGEASPYRGLLRDVPRLADDPPGVGPLGGLRALLAYAGRGLVVALGCDMPFVGAPVLVRLMTHDSEAAVLAPRRVADAPYEPLLARYRAEAVLPALDGALADGARSFQALFARLPVTVFPLDATEVTALRDWDRPDDLEP